MLAPATHVRDRSPRPSTTGSQRPGGSRSNGHSARAPRASSDATDSSGSRRGGAGPGGKCDKTTGSGLTEHAVASYRALALIGGKPGAGSRQGTLAETPRSRTGRKVGSSGTLRSGSFLSPAFPSSHSLFTFRAEPVLLGSR